MSTIRHASGFHPALTEARAKGRRVLAEPAAKAIFAEFGIAVPAGSVAATPAEARKAALALTAPFVTKIVSSAIIHKSDVGAVLVGLEDPGAVERAVVELAGLARDRGWQVDGYLVEEMAPAGRELVIGGTIDGRFGPVIMVGLGGVFVEVFGDVVFRICPIEEVDANDMLDDLKGASLLGSVRGQAPVDRSAGIAALLKVGGEDGLLIRLASQIQELDINPLIVSRSGAVAVDARIVIRENGA
jgi:succinyl-CoA synthetase beta subunit